MKMDDGYQAAEAVIPGRTAGADPESSFSAVSLDSGFDTSCRPGMTVRV
jgi:hypothetical protein